MKKVNGLHKFKTNLGEPKGSLFTLLTFSGLYDIIEIGINLFR